MVKKAFFIILIILIITMFVCPLNIVQATSTETDDTSKPSSSFVTGADNFLNSGKGTFQDAVDQESLKSASDLIYNTLLIVGICVAVIMGAILGLQFIMGSVEQKVKIKESLIPYFVGCIVLFGAFGIWRLVILLLR